jgi:hypothetical protein
MRDRHYIGTWDGLMPWRSNHRRERMRRGFLLGFPLDSQFGFINDNALTTR